MPTPTLDPNEILSREFEYAAQTALQANEDRVRVFNYYLATAGTVIAAVALADTATPGQLTVFALLFGGLALLGVLFALQLVKLRLSWTESIRAMCRIKEHYAVHAGSPELASAFRWNAKSIPAPGKKWSVAFLMALTVMLLSSACAGAAVFAAGLAAGGWWVAGSLIAGVAAFAAQVAAWMLLLRV